jgi:uncharacterized protein YuzE/plasmid stabilization system protein ParE
LKKVIVLADAAEDIEAARDFYERQGAGVGEYCVDSLLTDIESLGLFTGIHPFHFGFHRMLASRSPFGIYYRERGDETYFPDTDSLYIDLSQRPSVESQEVSEGVVLDYDAERNLVGIDIDHASSKLDSARARHKPYPP